MRRFVFALVVSVLAFGSVASAEEAVMLNKFCPISGEAVGSMGEPFKIEHEGKTYQLCCGMCAKDFQKDPQKYIEMINQEVQAAQEQVQEPEHDHGSTGY